METTMHAVIELRTLARTLATELQTIPLACRSWWDRHWALVDTRTALAARVVVLARQAGPAPRSLTTDALASPPRGWDYIEAGDCIEADDPAEPFVAEDLPIEATEWSWA